MSSAVTYWSRKTARIFFRNCVSTGELYPCECLDRLCEILCPSNFVKVRETPGGPAPSQTGDAVRDGQLGTALELLDKLLTAGEHPLKLLGGINFVYRPIARATELARQGVPLSESLVQAGVKSFTIQPVTGYLRRIGRPRAERIYRWLLDADRDLKGASPLPERAIIERLLVQLAGKT
jgi:hypothetical protein